MLYIITLIVVGLLLIFIEILLMPGFAITGILGIAALAGSYFYALNTFGQPVSTIILATDLVLVTSITIYVLRAKTWKRFQLHTNIESRSGAESPDEILETGDKGRTLSRLAPVGTARFHNKTYEVKSLEGYIDEDEEIEIVLIEDNHIIVRKTIDTNNQ